MAGRVELQEAHPSGIAPLSLDMMQMETRKRGSGSTNARSNFRWATKSLGPDQRLAAERTFTSLLVNLIRDAVGDALSRNVLEILELHGLLDASNSQEFDQKLRSLFCNGAVVLERIVVKDLDRKLGIPYRPDADFDYEKSLETAKEVCFVESRLL
jgi:hypothetical protein